MPQKLVARLHDGSEHVVKVLGNAEDALKRLTGTDFHGPWVDVEGGSVRYDSIVALHLVEEDLDQAINALLLELRARGGGTLDDVKRELERRGIALPEKAETG